MIDPSRGSDASGTEPRVPAIRSADLFRDTREVVIIHHDERYRLRITRAGKLILTK